MLALALPLARVGKSPPCDAKPNVLSKLRFWPIKMITTFRDIVDNYPSKSFPFTAPWPHKKRRRSPKSPERCFNKCTSGIFCSSSSCALRSKIPQERMFSVRVRAPRPHPDSNWADMCWLEFRINKQPDSETEDLLIQPIWDKHAGRKTPSATHNTHPNSALLELSSGLSGQYTISGWNRIGGRLKGVKRIRQNCWILGRYYAVAPFALAKYRSAWVATKFDAHFTAQTCAHGNTKVLRTPVGSCWELKTAFYLFQVAPNVLPWAPIWQTYLQINVPHSTCAICSSLYGVRWLANHFELDGCTDLQGHLVVRGVY